MLKHSFYTVFVIHCFNEERTFLVDVFMHAQTLKTRHLVAMTCYDRYVIHIYHKCYAIKEERQCCVFLRIRLVANSPFYAFV